MKKTIFLSFSLLFGLGYFSTSFADIIPSNSHFLDRCIKIVNLDEFPGIVLIGQGAHPSGSYTSYQIKSNECLTKGYKLNRFSLYWSTVYKPSIESGELIPLNIEPYGGYISNNNPLIKEYIEYSIAGLYDGKPILYKSKQVSDYNNGIQQKTEVFERPVINKQSKTVIEAIPSQNTSKDISNTGNTSVNSQQPIKRGFWKTIFCFYSEIFGLRCR